MHVFSFICVGERRRVGRETESQEAAPGRSSLDPEFLGRGLLSHPTPDSGSGQVPFPNTCTDLWASNHCQMCPCYWIFPASLCPLFLPSFFFRRILPPRLALPSPTQLQELLLGVGDGMFLVSAQLGSPGNPGNGKELGSFAHISLLCIILLNGQKHEIFPSLTPGWPPTPAVVLVLETIPTSWMR